MPTLRPLTPDDAHATFDLLLSTFSELARRMGERESEPPSDREPGLERVRHLARTDPGGAWASVDEDGRLIGAALALVRDGLWGLSLLIVDPEHQSAGVGSALLREALAYGEGSRGGLILASPDERALRAYFRAGFELRPVIDAVGEVRVRPPESPAVREGSWPDDHAIADAASFAVRGASHARDIPKLLMNSQLLVHDRGGFALHTDGDIRLLAAHDDAAAAELLRACLRAAPEGAHVGIGFIAARHDWALEVALAAGLRLQRSGAIMVRGDVGPLAPYLPSGAYL